MRQWTHLTVLVVILAAAVLASMCGSQPPTSPAPQPSPTPSAPPPTYAISGAVTDSVSGRPIAGSKVSATSEANAPMSASTDVNGAYAIRGLPSGPLTVHAEAAAYTATDKTITLQADARVDLALQPIVVAAPRCDPGLWNHMHDPQRIKTLSACQTVTGTIASIGSSEDGDIDMQLTLDPPYANLLNAGNISKLNGNLQIEAICQTKVHPDVPDALRACANFTGTVPIPPVGTHVQVTGTHVLDSDHGWNEIHPISVLTVR